MDQNRKNWNERQQELRNALAHPGDASIALQLFLEQHAAVHSRIVFQDERWSFEDEVMEGLSLAQIRTLPQGCEHSIAWIIWHITRIEDVTMNLLVAGEPQLFLKDGWVERVNPPDRATGNAMNPMEVARFSDAIDLVELRAYREAVGQRTRQVVCRLKPADLKKKVDAGRLKQVTIEGAVVEAAREITAYWGSLTIAGLLLMPPTRHSFLHWNEALRLRRKVGRG